MRRLNHDFKEALARFPRERSYGTRKGRAYALDQMASTMDGQFPGLRAWTSRASTSSSWWPIGRSGGCRWAPWRTTCSYADRGARIVLKASTTKGDRPRSADSGAPQLQRAAQGLREADEGRGPQEHAWPALHVRPAPLRGHHGLEAAAGGRAAAEVPPWSVLLQMCVPDLTAGASRSWARYPRP